MKVVNLSKPHPGTVGGLELTTGRVYRCVKSNAPDFVGAGEHVLAVSTSAEDGTPTAAASLETGRTLWGLLSNEQRFVEVDAEVVIK